MDKRTKSSRNNCLRFRGGTYVMVLVVAMVVTVIGFSSLLVARVQQCTFAGTNDSAEARIYAESAVDIALYTVNKNPAWRSDSVHDTWMPSQRLGRGMFKWKLVDEVDTDLNNKRPDPVRIVAWGMVGRAIQKLSVRLVPAPLEALRMGIHCDGDLVIEPGASLSVSGAAGSTNAQFANDGTLHGSIEATTQIGSGAVTGTTNVPMPAKMLPSAAVFSDYVAKATALPYNGELDNHVLTPTRNEYGGGLNPNGVYYINTGGDDLIIKGSRIHGTLVVNTGGGRVILNNQVFIHTYCPNYPVLIVQGELILNYSSAGTYLHESDWEHNFNPSGAAYQGQTDIDQSDQYPSEIQGLVHVTGELTMDQTSRVIGMIICEGAVTSSGLAQIDHDSSLVINPPEGYQADGQMVIAPSSWTKVVD